MNPEAEDTGGGVPEWVVTFGDMMSLLLTFFIMLVSLSEIKEQEKYQALVESIQRQFGYTTSTASLAPGNSKPRNSNLSKLATLGRARRKNTAQGGANVKAPVGEEKRVQIVRPGKKTAVGTVVFFAEGSAQLTDAGKRTLEQQGSIFRGKPQKIEVRGHTSQKPAETTETGDSWSLAFQRCQATKKYLVTQLGIDPRRIRLSVAGPYEPLHLGTDPALVEQNARVEVFLLDEVVNERLGTEQERRQQFTTGHNVEGDK